MTAPGDRRETDPFTLTEALFDPALLLRAEWSSWMDVKAPFVECGFTRHEVETRFYRNGYYWDVHGTLLVPEREAVPGTAFVMTHGGAGSEYELLETPDGRPGIAEVTAAQGFKVLTVTWVGHHHPSGQWTSPVSERLPIYLFDTETSVAEAAERSLACTYNVTVQGIAELADMTLAGYRLISFGHSTGGPMSVSLQSFLTKSTVAGIVGWASGGPDGWYREWLMWLQLKTENIVPLEHLARRTVQSFRSAGYEGEAELCPWGDAENYMRWGDLYKSQLKTSVCENQHKANIEQLHAYAERTALPVDEFTDHLRDPDPDWLARTPVLLLVGERDRNHWAHGTEDEHRLEVFMGRKFQQRSPRTKVVCLPRYGHYGYVERYNERLAWLWIAALDNGFFCS